VVGATDTFNGKVGAPNDRLFVLDALAVAHVNPVNPATAASANHSWYLLRIAPGTAHPATLTRLAITGPNDAAQITGLALSPDAGTLAVYYQNKAATHAAGPYTLRLFSVSTGQVLRTWTAPGKDLGYWSVPSDVNSSDLTWAVTSPTLAFLFPPFPFPEGSSDERTLNVSGSLGGSLLGESQSVFPDPGSQNNCLSMLLSSDGRTLVCGTMDNASGCRAQEPLFDLYSGTVTGKLDRVLYRYQGGCMGALPRVVWTGATGTAIGVIQTSSAGGLHETVVVVTPGKFTPLRVPVPAGYGADSGQLAF
jgi:hypothetical protein